MLSLQTFSPPASCPIPILPAYLPRIAPAHCLSAFSAPSSSLLPHPHSPRMPAPYSSCPLPVCFLCIFLQPQAHIPAGTSPRPNPSQPVASCPPATGLTGFERAWESHHCPLTTGRRPAIRVPKPQGFGTFLLSQCLVSALQKGFFDPFFASKGYTLLAYTLYPFAQNTTTPSNDHPPVCGPKHYTLSAKTLLPLQPEKCTVWGNRPRPRRAKGGGERGN